MIVLKILKIIKKVCLETPDNNHMISMLASPYIDERINHLFEKQSDIQYSDRYITEDAVMKDIVNNDVN